MTGLLTHYNVSMEAIKHQYNSTLRLQLIDLFKKFMGKSPTSKQLVSAGLGKIIKAETGLSYKIGVWKNELNAAVKVPELGKNNVLIDDFHRDFIDEKDWRATVVKSKKVYNGSVNLDKSKVTGIFTKIPFEMFIGTGLFNKKYKLTPEEIASIILHEIGHTFTFLELLTHNVRSNMALVAVAQGVEESASKEERMEVLETIEYEFDLNIDDKEELTKTKDPNTYVVIVGSNIKQNYRNAMGNPHYDIITCEYLADQFSTRHGGGKDIITGLDKIHRTHGYGNAGFNTPTYLFVCMLDIVTMIGAIALSFTPLAKLAGWFIGMRVNTEWGAIDIYDEPKERYQRVRDQLVDSTKSKNISKEYRKQVADQIKKSDEIIDGLYEQRTYPLRFVLNILRPKKREMIRTMKIQKEMEKLGNNNFFVTANRLQTV